MMGMLPRHPQQLCGSPGNDVSLKFERTQSLHTGDNRSTLVELDVAPAPNLRN